MLWISSAEVDKIVCGCYHSYVRTNNGFHYLFGSNSDFECLQGICADFYGDEHTFQVKRPYCFNRVIKRKYNKKIIDVYLGYHCTKLIVGDDVDEYWLGKQWRWNLCVCLQDNDKSNWD